MKTIIDDGIVQGYADQQNCHLHYYGAWQLEDWLHVAQCAPRLNYHGIILGVHRGFAKLAERAIKMLPDWPSYRLTGHSMGGAIALLVGYYLHKQGKAVTVETAGTPRTVYAWAHHHFKNLKVDRWTIPVDRWTIPGDPVPHLPPAPIFLHVGRHREIPDHTQGIEAHEPKIYQRYVPWATYPEQDAT